MHNSSGQELGHLQAAFSPSTSVSPAGLLLTPTPASASWFPQKRQGPRSTAKKIRDSVPPALPLTPTRTSRSPRTRTRTHTRVPFPHRPPLPTSRSPSLFSTSSPASQSWKEPPRSPGSSLPTQNHGLDIFCMIPAKTPPPSSCTPPGMASSLPPKQPSAFGLLTIASAQCTAEIFLWFRPLALSFPEC